MNSEQMILKIHRTPLGGSVQLFENIWAFRVYGHEGLYGQTYLILRENKALLIDAVHFTTYHAIQKILREQGAKVEGIVLTHADLLSEMGTDGQTLVERFDNAPVIMHPKDLSPRHQTDSYHQHMKILDFFKLHVWHFEGHTPGSIVLCYPEHGGVIFSGDSAIGSSYDSMECGLSRPVLSLDQEEALINQWETIDADIRHILPLHGKPILGCEEIWRVLLELTEPESVRNPMIFDR